MRLFIFEILFSKKGGENVSVQNHSFINKNCEICGKSELVLSSFNLCCNYGSKNDGEELTLNICGDCADKIYQTIQNLSEVKENQ